MKIYSVVPYPVTLRPSWRLLWAVARALVTRRVVAFEYPVVIGQEDAAEAQQPRTLQ